MDKTCPANRRITELEARAGKLVLRSKSDRLEIKKLRSLVKDIKAWRKTDKAVIHTLEAKVKALAAEVKKFEARVKMDSGNSSKQPSSDGLSRKTHKLVSQKLSNFTHEF